MVNPQDNFGPFCEDLFINILCRLTERDVLRCKCVSKEWHRIVTNVCVSWLSVQAPISGFYFRVAIGKDVIPLGLPGSFQDVKDQINHLVAYNHSIHYIGNTSFKPGSNTAWLRSCVVSCSPEMSLDGLLPFEHRGPDFLDCCNGLVLFVQRPRPQFYVCNPTIKQCVPVPLPPPSMYLPSLYASLAFDPSVSIEYKVVTLSLTTQPQFFHVFYSQTGEWKSHEVKIEPLTSSKCFKLVRHSVYLKNIVYRLSMFYKILCFDLDSGKAHLLNCPSQKSCVNLRDAEDEHEPPPGCIGVSNGYLSYVADEDEHACVWLLEKPTESSQWTLKFRIHLRPLWKDVRKSCFKSRIIWLRSCGFHPTSDILFLGCSGSLFMYHIGSCRLQIARSINLREVNCGYYFPIFLHKSIFVILKNWCKDVDTKIDGYEVEDRWCYLEQ